MAKRSFLGVSEGHGCPQRTSGDGARAIPTHQVTSSPPLHTAGPRQRHGSAHAANVRRRAMGNPDPPGDVISAPPYGRATAAPRQRHGSATAANVRRRAMGHPDPPVDATSTTASAVGIDPVPAVLKQVAGVGVAGVGGTAAEHHYDQLPAVSLAAGGQTTASRKGGARLHARISLNA